MDAGLLQSDVVYTALTKKAGCSKAVLLHCQALHLTDLKSPVRATQCSHSTLRCLSTDYTRIECESGLSIDCDVTCKALPSLEYRERKGNSLSA